MIAAEFGSADTMRSAVVALRRAGYEEIETYAPFDIPDLDEALALKRSRINWLVLAGGIAGLLIGYGVQWWANVHSYPLNVGGRPAHAVPAFILITFESTVLGAALAAFFGWMFSLRFPKLWAPEDEIPGFERASIDRFWIVVRPGDSTMLREHAVQVMSNAGAWRTVDVDAPAWSRL